MEGGIEEPRGRVTTQAREPRGSHDTSSGRLYRAGPAKFHLITTPLILRERPAPTRGTNDLVNQAVLALWRVGRHGRGRRAGRPRLGARPAQGGDVVTAGRRERVRRIVAEAAGCDPLVREALLSDRCGGDDALRAEVLRLLRDDTVSSPEDSQASRTDAH